jgi:hypothetical protein
MLENNFCDMNVSTKSVSVYDKDIFRMTVHGSLAFTVDEEDP